MRILHVASEAYPFSRTGGLADVMAALPAELARLGHQAVVLSPWYADLVGTPHEIWRGGDVRLGELTEGGVRFLFLETPAFKRRGIYHPDDVQRFSAWGQLVLPVLAASGVRFDVLHGHDWAAGLVIAHARLRHIPSVFTIHNLQYQGRWNIHDGFAWTGLPQWFNAAQGVEFYGDLNSDESRAGLRRTRHHRQPDLRPGNHHPRIRRGARRRAARPAGRRADSRASSTGWTRSDGTRAPTATCCPMAA